uniref:3-oxoadipate enol-lactonase n=1 Tax=Bosea sp. NBC_00436 TaxID=2969620 RepID=A0A9E8A479_9HYPH
MQIDIGGEAFEIRVDGPTDAPPLLLSNSLSSDMSMWDDQIPLWSHHFRVIRYDQRGHGCSVVTPAPYTMDQLGRDALGILDALQIKRAHFCGLSMGGMVGMWLLTQAPERLDHAVLANTAAYMGPPRLWNERIEAAGNGGMQSLVDATITRWFPESFRDASPAVINRMRAMILNTPVIGYQASCMAIRDMDLRQSITAISNPVMVIMGSWDPATPPSDGEYILEAIPGARRTLLEAGHISNIDQAAKFGAEVAMFLR